MTASFVRTPSHMSCWHVFVHPTYISGLVVDYEAIAEQYEFGTVPSGVCKQVNPLNSVSQGVVRVCLLCEQVVF